MALYGPEQFALMHSRRRAAWLRELRLIDRFIHDPIKCWGMSGDFIQRLQEHRRELDIRLSVH